MALLEGWATLTRHCKYVCVSIVYYVCTMCVCTDMFYMFAYVVLLLVHTCSLFDDSAECCVHVLMLLLGQCVGVDAFLHISVCVCPCCRYQTASMMS